MGKPATARSAGVVGSTEPDDRGTESGHRAGSRKVPRSAATDDSSRCRPTHRAGFCADHRESRAISVWETDCELSRTGATGKVQRKSETAGSHHQTREFDGALFAGGGGAGHSAQSSRVAQEVRPPDDAARTQDRQAVKKFGSHAGQLGTGDGNAVKHRVIEWAARSSSRRSSK